MVGFNTDLNKIPVFEEGTRIIGWVTDDSHMSS